MSQRERSLDYKTLAQHLVDRYQDDFPLESRPYESIAKGLQTSEQEVMECLGRMKESGLIGRVGPLYNAQRMGASALAAVACDPSRIEAVAGFINKYHEVNHNYQREDELNLWFVITAPDQKRLNEVISEIESGCGVRVLKFPMVRPYKIDLSYRENIDWEAL